jgi:NTE family protein
MARVHVLRGQDRVFGFTLDEQGTNLPQQYGPWTTFKTIELHHDEPYQGVDVSVCLDDISKHGFHLTAAHKRITHLAVGSVPVMSGRALVLGGGGAAGNAWLIGVIAGLFKGGLDVTEADLTIGTSAGSTAAAQITSGTLPTELLADILAAETQPRIAPVGSDGGRVPIGPAANHMEITSAIIGAAEDAADMRRRMGAVALETDAASHRSAQTQWRATVAARLPSQLWPQRRMLIPAVDAHTGEPVVFDRHSGVDLVDAVAASTSNGFGVPPYSIGDRRYINGGYRRNENADLAAGYARVLVLSPFGGRSRHPLDWGMHLATQVDELRARGSRVETIFPDSNSEHMFGANAMDLSTRPPAARAGYDQGRALVAQLTEFWR